MTSLQNKWEKYESLLHESYKTELKHEDMFEQYSHGNCISYVRIA
jgi:hypothetical protein